MELRRPHPANDFEAVLDLVQSCDRAIFGESDWTARELREDWESLDLEQDAWLAIDEGRLAGVIHVFERRGNRVRSDGYVHPDLTGRGAGSLLLGVAECRALEVAGPAAAGEPLSIETAHLVGDPGAPALFVSRGYTRVRNYHRLVIDVRGGVPEPSWPAPLELRPFDPGREAREVEAAIDDAFEHEWGYERATFDDWSARSLAVDGFDPSLCPVVWNGNQVVAVSLNYPKRNGDWGWIGNLAVRPAWRRRGLGMALLVESFRRFAETGETTVGLTVDSQNPTGATRLYERAGMRVLWRADVWRKELRESVPVASP